MKKHILNIILFFSILVYSASCNRIDTIVTNRNVYDVNEAFIKYDNITSQPDNTLWFKIWPTNLASVNDTIWSPYIPYHRYKNTITFYRNNFLLYDIKLDITLINDSVGKCNIYHRTDSIWYLVGKNGNMKIINNNCQLY